MALKYCTPITESTVLDRRSGANAVTPPRFNELGTSFVSTCTYLQSLLQHVIYVTHGAELLEAKRTLKAFPNPKARIDFLCSYPYSEADPVVSSVFEYARILFRDLYEFRNVLCHELWSSSDAYPDAVIFSSLDEEARILMTSGRMWHTEDATPQEVLDATIRYIRSVNIVRIADLNAALCDANLCALILIHVGTVLNEKDPARREEARHHFRVFQGTSHLFGGQPPDAGTVTFRASRSREIKG